MKILYSPSWAGFSIGENAEKRLQAKYHLRRKGYTEAQANRILKGECPRDLPDLIEAFEMFGGDGVTCEEIEEQPYCITCDDESTEDIITKDDFAQPGVKMDPKGKPEDWELVDIARSGEAVRLANILNGFIEDEVNGSPFVVNYEREVSRCETERERNVINVKRFFFTHVDLLTGDEYMRRETGLECNLNGIGGSVSILNDKEVSGGRFELDRAKRVLVVRSITEGNSFEITIFRGNEDEYDEFDRKRRWDEDDEECEDDGDYEVEDDINEEDEGEDVPVVDDYEESSTAGDTESSKEGEVHFGSSPLATCSNYLPDSAEEWLKLERRLNCVLEGHRNGDENPVVTIRKNWDRTGACEFSVDVSLERFVAFVSADTNFPERGVIKGSQDRMSLYCSVEAEAHGRKSLIKLLDSFAGGGCTIDEDEVEGTVSFTSFDDDSGSWYTKTIVFNTPLS